jgi:predicted acylesterase/phospholipase RssA
MGNTRETVEAVLNGDVPLPTGDSLVSLVRELEKDAELFRARRLLLRARSEAIEPREAVWITQQLALCTYRDEELMPSQRFAEAITILESIGLRAPEQVDSERIPSETLAETLALGGAVYKGLFEHNGQVDDLLASQALYEAAWRWDPVMDKARGGVNAAYILDILAGRTSCAGIRLKACRHESSSFATRARQIREEMKAKLPEITDAIKRETRPGQKQDPEQEYRYSVTVAEIHFGLGEYEEAGRWLAKAQKLETEEWKKQTTFRQLLSTARLHGYIPPSEDTGMAKWEKPWQALAAFLGNDAEMAFSCWRGKVGLALSGGGFRASFFHLGVMARLAEMDVLRSVEVLSTVSGGSIVGAHYYLEVQNLLEKESDRKISRAAYIEIISRVQEQFLAGVQRNLRTRTLSNIFSNLRMIFSKGYSRSHRIGEMYESELYKHVSDSHPKDKPRTMPQLLIGPPGEKDRESFKPKISNWRRRAKVPVLLLNTTSLNSGHNWHFTAKWMGEPPGLLGEEVDANVRYRRLYYEDAPTKELKRYRLGHAVAASACVPALFEPLAIEGLYRGRTVRLVDGGVHDNQGVQGLLDESCTFILCSDASGQMEDSASPSDGLLGVSLRSNSILQDRVREAEYQDLHARVRDHALQGFFFVHLKQDLVPGTLDWVGCKDVRTEAPCLNITSYGIDRDLQNKLAAVRTDLDSFTEVEAYSLMLSGYLMTEERCKELNRQYQCDGGVGTWGGFDVDAPRRQWPFLALEEIASKPPESTDERRQDLGKQLQVAAQSAFKVWRLSPLLQRVSICALAVLIASLVVFLYLNWGAKIEFGAFRVGTIVIALAVLVAGSIWPFIKLLNPRKAMRGYVFKAALGLLGWVAANVHMHVFDRIFLKRGKLDRLLALSGEERTARHE